MFRKWVHPFLVLWRFSRPHTIIGSTFSVSALFLLALAEQPGWSSLRAVLLLITLISCLACNIFITGLNQWADVELDRLNKPRLPIPSGMLSKNQALNISLACLLIALLLALWLSIYFFILIALISLIGAVYSLPPIKFKRHHLGAAAAISLVRGLLVNLGIFLHYRIFLTGSFSIPEFLWPLTAFVFFFSLAIAWFKDIPDSAGDAVFHIRTVAVQYSRTAALRLGLWLVTLSYFALAYCFGKGFLTPQVDWIAAVHIGAGLSFFILGYRLDVRNNKAVHRFYMGFWGLFFLEYILYTLGIWWPIIS
ncbi:MAG: homogentisate phytyltransferase [Bacteroidetes bacterium]|nr:homogentisate phytyltransferase [Bacteroidota bacterium]